MNAKSNNYQVQTLLHQGRFEEARLILRGVFCEDKQNAESWYLYGVASAQLSDLKEAINGFRQAAKLTPRMTMVQYNLGLALQMDGQLNEAVVCYQRAISGQPDLTEAHFNLGNIYFSMGEAHKAKVCFQKAIKLKPGYIDARMNYAACFESLNDFNSAIKVFKKILNAHPEIKECYQKLGNAYLCSGNPAAAVTWLQQAIMQTPRKHGLHCQLGDVWSALGNLENAEECYLSELNIQPDFISAHVCLGVIQLKLGRIEEAQESAGKALALDNDHLDAHVLKASLLDQGGDAGQAYEALKPLVNRDQVNSYFATVFAKVCGHADKYAEAISVLEKLLRSPREPITQHREFHFSLGDLYDSTSDYKQAFNHYRKGNQLKGAEFNSDKNRHLIDRLVNFFNKKQIPALPKATNNSELPVFIVGMPRSGTSLVEQIVASHPQVYGAGELPDMWDLVDTLPAHLNSDLEYPECIRIQDSEILTTMGKPYLEKLTQFASEFEVRVTDKLPGNFLHLGLISLLFPAARVIHCVRNPLDTCLSVYFKDFSGAVPYAYNLEHIGHYYMEYRRLMRHWEEVLDLPILTVSYEGLVAGQETVSRNLIEFCGLEWDESCLSYYLNPRFVRTASADQVRKPIYKHAIGRSGNYEKYLGRLREILN